MAKGSIQIALEECKGCKLCVAHCPRKCISIGTTINENGYFPAEFTPNAGERGCNGCSFCATICPDVAITVYRASTRERGAS